MDGHDVGVVAERVPVVHPEGEAREVLARLARRRRVSEIARVDVAPVHDLPHGDGAAGERQHARARCGQGLDPHARQRAAGGSVEVEIVRPERVGGIRAGAHRAVGGGRRRDGGPGPGGAVDADHVGGALGSRGEGAGGTAVSPQPRVVDAPARRRGGVLRIRGGELEGYEACHGGGVFDHHLGGAVFDHQPVVRRRAQHGVRRRRVGDVGRVVRQCRHPGGEHGDLDRAAARRRPAEHSRHRGAKAGSGGGQPQLDAAEVVAPGIRAGGELLGAIVLRENVGARHRGLPQIADQRRAPDVGRGRGRDGPVGRIGGAGARLRGPLAVEEEQLHLDLLARVEGVQAVPAGGRAGDIGVGPRIDPDPLVAELGKYPVDVRDRAPARLQALADGRGAGDRRPAGGGGVGHRRDEPVRWIGGAGARLRVSPVVGEGQLHLDLHVLVGGVQEVAAGGRAGDIALGPRIDPDPLVAERGRYPVGVRDRAPARLQALADGRRAGDLRRAGGGAVGRGQDGSARRKGGAGARLRVSRVVGEGQLHLDPIAQVVVAQQVAAGGRAGDIALGPRNDPDPLVAERGRYPVDVRDRAPARLQALADGRGAGDRRRAGGGGVDAAAVDADAQGSGVRGEGPGRIVGSLQT